MINGSASIEIEAPIDEVYAAAANAEGLLRRQPEIKVVECIERDGAGNQVLVHMEIDAKVWRAGSDVRYSHEKPSRISWEQEDGDLKSVKGTWELKDLGDGRTHVSYWMEVDLGRVLGLGIRGPIRGVLSRQMIGGMPGRLKRFVEDNSA